MTLNSVCITAVRFEFVFVPIEEIEKVDRDMVVDHMAEQMMEDLRADIEITSAMDPEINGYVFRGRLRILKEE